MSEDTTANRQLLKDVANNENNFLGTDSYGVDWYAKTTEDGKQIWTQTRNGKIINGGVNEAPKQFNEKTGLSNQTKPKSKK